MSAPENTKAAPEFQRGQEIVIELGNDRCCDIMFNPLQQTFRGRYERNKLNGHVSPTEYPHMARIEEVPGAYVSLDISARTLRVYDPLSLEKYKRLRDEVLYAQRDIDTGSYTTFETVACDQLSQERLATFAYWMKRLVDEGKARLVQGRFPEKPLPGRVQIEFFNSDHKAKRYQDEYQEAAA